MLHKNPCNKILLTVINQWDKNLFFSNYILQVGNSCNTGARKNAKYKENKKSYLKALGLPPPVSSSSAWSMLVLYRVFRVGQIEQVLEAVEVGAAPKPELVGGFLPTQRWRPVEPGPYHLRVLLHQHLDLAPGDLNVFLGSQTIKDLSKDECQVISTSSILEAKIAIFSVFSYLCKGNCW